MLSKYLVHKIVSHLSSLDDNQGGGTRRLSVWTTQFPSLGFNFSGVTLPMHTWAEISRISPYMEPGTLSKVLSLPKNDTFISHRAI